MTESKRDIIDDLLSELYEEKRDYALNLTKGKFETAAKKITTKHLDKIKNETKIPEA